MNANLFHKFSITDEEYNPVEGSVLNVKQKVAYDSLRLVYVAVQSIGYL